jgi:hypothetical protein
MTVTPYTFCVNVRHLPPLAVGAREHRASYLRTVPISAHAWGEYREVRT